MTIPTTIASLSTTAASNNPTGSAQRTEADDGLRQGYAFTKMTVSAGTDITSGSTITPAQDGQSFAVTGTTTITTIASTNSWDGRLIWLRFAGILTLTHSSNLSLPGSANITTAASDVACFRQTSSGAWQCINYYRADGSHVGIAYLPLTGGSLSGNLTIGANILSGSTAAGYTISSNPLATLGDGAYLQLFGSTHANTGLLIVAAGAAAMQLRTNGTVRQSIGSNGVTAFSGAVYTTVNAQAFSATPTFDASLSNVFEMDTLTANVTSCTINNPSAGQTISIRVNQGGSWTFASPSGAKIAGSVGLTAGAVSILTIMYSFAGARWEGAWTQLPA